MAQQIIKVYLVIQEQVLLRIYQCLAIKGRNYVGGVGYQYNGTVKWVYNTQGVEALGSHAGGIIGLVEHGTLYSAYNRGEIIANSYAGGCRLFIFRY